MCSRDYFEPIAPTDRGRNDGSHRLVCPIKEERERKRYQNEVEVVRLKRENERLLSILENVSKGS